MKKLYAIQGTLQGSTAKVYFYNNTSNLYPESSETEHTTYTDLKEAVSTLEIATKIGMINPKVYELVPMLVDAKTLAAV